jgi:hypothetical protein
MIDEENKGQFNCSICGSPASLEDCKIDEHGLPVHESCQVIKLLPQSETPSPFTFPKKPVRLKKRFL